MSDKISVQQRKYFAERIEKAIDSKISLLKHKNASRVTNMGNKQFQNYLEEIGIKDSLARYTKLEKEYNDLNESMKLTYSNIRRALNIADYQSDWPSVYKGSNAEGFEKGFRRCCEEIALQNNEGSKIGLEIENLERQKRQATDILHGVNGLDGLMIQVNQILTGAGVPQLGE